MNLFFFIKIASNNSVFMFSICIYHSCVNCTKWKFIKNNINKRCFYFGDVLLKVVPMDSLLVLYDFLIGKIVRYLRIIEIF